MNQIAIRVQAIKAWRDENPLRQWRNAQGISQRILAAMIDVNLYTIQSWELGTSYPTEDNMTKIVNETHMPDMADKWTAWLDQRPVQTQR